MEEIWKDIINYEGIYQVSNLGRVKRLIFKNNHCVMPKEKILKPLKHGKTDNEYLMVSLSKNSKEKQYYIHRLVAEAFIPKVKNKNQINHKNGIKNDNRIENIEWCNNSENQRHALKMGLKIPAKGLKCGNVRAVRQYTKSGSFIKQWDYLTQASRTLNISLPNIIRNCQNQIPSAGGYVWKYVEGDE